MNAFVNFIPVIVCILFTGACMTLVFIASIKVKERNPFSEEPQKKGSHAIT